MAIGVVVVTAGILVSAMPPASATVAVGVAAAPVSAAPGQARPADVDTCLAAGAAVEDAALAVQAHRRNGGVELVSRLRRAEARLGADLDAAEPRLGVAVRNVRDAIAGLRQAIEFGSRVDQATEAVLDRIDDLDTICQARLRPLPPPGS